MPGSRDIDIEDLVLEPDEIDGGTDWYEAILIDDPPLAENQHILRKKKLTPPWYATAEGSNQLGQRQLFKPDSEYRQAILKLSPKGPPRTWGVSLNLDFDKVNGSADMNFAILADIVCGIGGASQRFQVDWQNGMRFPIFGNYVEVTAIYSSAILGGETQQEVPPELNVSVVLSGESSSMTYPPTRTFLVQGTEMAGNPLRSPVEEIPNHATRVKVIPASSNAWVNLYEGPVWDQSVPATVFRLFPLTRIVFLHGTDPANVVAFHSIWSPEEPEFRIPNGARYWYFEQSTDLDVEDYFVQFDLAL